MSLPETIWWCKTHGQRGRYSDKCIMVSYLEVQGASVADLCHMVEVDLHPVGSRVAGRDDLLIRREDIDYEAAKRAAFEMAEQIAQARYEGQRFSLTEVNDLKVRAAVDAALAAAERGET